MLGPDVKPQRRLRLIAVDGQLTGPPPPPPSTSITSIDAALAVMRLCVAIIESGPTDLVRGFNADELAAQFSATDNMIDAFHALDRLLTASRKRSKTQQPTRKPTRERTP